MKVMIETNIGTYVRIVENYKDIINVVSLLSILSNEDEAFNTNED